MNKLVILPHIAFIRYPRLDNQYTRGLVRSGCTSTRYVWTSTVINQQVVLVVELVVVVVVVVELVGGGREQLWSLSW